MIRITDGRYIRNVYGIPVVADIFRTTTNITVMFMRNVEEVVPVASIEDAMALRGKGYLLFGEENTEVLKGFDYGNSPPETSELDLSGKRVAIKTTNGTSTILKAGEGTLIGSFLNIDAIARFIRNREAHIFPSNERNGTATEDNEFAYALTKRALEPGSDVKVHIERSRTGTGARRLMEHGLQRDIEFSLQLNVTEMIPIFREGKIVPMK